MPDQDVLSSHPARAADPGRRRMVWGVVLVVLALAATGGAVAVTWRLAQLSVAH